MGFLISINGADFEPYRAVSESSPLVSRVRKTQKTAPVHRGRPKGDETFNEIIQKTLVGHHYNPKPTVEESKKKSRKAVIAKDLMSSPVISIEGFLSLEKALKLLDDYGFRHLPVVDEKEKSIGIIKPLSET